MTAYELPAWLRASYVAIPHPRRFPVAYDEPLFRSLLERIERDGYRAIGRAEARCSLVVVRAWLAWPARLEWWWRRHAQYKLAELAVRIGLLYEPYEGCFYRELRPWPPDLGKRLREKWTLLKWTILQ